MSLSSDLIAQFVKATKPTETKNRQTTVYGKAYVEESGDIKVLLDGSDTPTPAITTTEIQNGERVTALMKDHRVIVTGNIDSPAARNQRVDRLAKDLVDTTDFVVDQAEITTALVQDLTATKATVASLSAKQGEFEILLAGKATIDALNAVNAKIDNLDVRVFKGQSASIDELIAGNASITKLQSDLANVETLYSNMVHAHAADIDALDTDVANINVLMFGSGAGTTIQTSFSNSVIAQLGDAQIKSAMIDSVSASKITVGDILTNNVRITSDDGRLLISDETIQISDASRVRVQIGKDASNDYSINVWDQNGKLMFSKGGITDSAIKEAIIRNEMISDTANISASKLDIDSLFDEINESSKTIKSSKVYLDEKKQTLDVSFKAITTDVSNLSNTVSSQGTAISVIQGQITSKIWQQDITSATNTLSTQYSTLSQDLASFMTTVGNTYATQKSLTSAETKLDQSINAISAIATRTTNNESAISALELTADGLTTTVNAAKKQLYHSASGTSGTTGYVGICSVKINGSYQNRPILFELNNRGRQASNVSLCFKNVDSADPVLEHLQYDGGIKVWAYKTAASTWTLIAEKSEGYDTIYVKDFANNNGNTVVSWTNVHYSSIPTSDITAGTLLAAKLTKETVDNAAKTATNYLNFSTAGLVVGDMTAATLGRNVLIDSDSVDIRNGTTVYSSFGDNYLYLAKHSRNATIDLCNGLAKMYHQSRLSYDTLFVIETPNATEIRGTADPLCVTSTVASKPAIKFANKDGVLGSIGMVESGTESYITRNHPSTAATYSILDTGNFYKIMDSGYVNVVPQSGFTIYSNGNDIKYRKIAKMVEVSGVMKPTSEIAASDTKYTMGVLPATCWPSRPLNILCQGSGIYVWMLTVTTGGELQFSKYRNGDTRIACPVGAWLPFHITYFAES